jgi:predicted nuclease of predicted toxin-antitoxin system
MRLLADENFPKPIVEALRAGGHDVLWARTDCAGWKDPVLLDLAESEARILLMLDKDFWQIAVQRRVPLKQSGVVLFRAHPATAEHLDPGHISIIAADGIQMPAARTRSPTRGASTPCVQISLLTGRSDGPGGGSLAASRC